MERQKRVGSRLRRWKTRMPFSRMGRADQEHDQDLGQEAEAEASDEDGREDDLGTISSVTTRGSRSSASGARRRPAWKRYAEQIETPKPTIVSMPVTRVYSQMRWMLRTYCTRIALGGGMISGDMEEADDRLPRQDEADAENDRRQIFGDLVAIHHRRPQISP